MTEVRFILNVPEKLAYACRVARRSFMQARQMAIVGAVDELRQIDQLLWAMDPADFVAHSLHLEAEHSIQPEDAWSPLILLAEPQQAGHTDTLLNLLADVPRDFSRFSVLYELVSAGDEADKQHARGRWRHYQQRGYAISSHDLMKGSAP